MQIQEITIIGLSRGRAGIRSATVTCFGIKSVQGGVGTPLRCGTVTVTHVTGLSVHLHSSPSAALIWPHRDVIFAIITLRGDGSRIPCILVILCIRRLEEKA